MPNENLPIAATGELKALVDAVNRLDNSREKSLALTKLEEAEMWIEKAYLKTKPPTEKA